MTTPLPSRSVPSALAVKASSGTVARTVTIDLSLELSGMVSTRGICSRDTKYEAGPAPARVDRRFPYPEGVKRATSEWMFPG